MHGESVLLKECTEGECCIKSLHVGKCSIKSMHGGSVQLRASTGGCYIQRMHRGRNCSIKDIAWGKVFSYEHALGGRILLRASKGVLLRAYRGDVFY